MFVALEVSNALASVEANFIVAMGVVFIPAVAALAGWGLSILERRLKIDANSRAGQVFEDAISHGLALGSQQVGEVLRGGGTVGHPTDAVVDIAHDYAAPKLDAEMAKLGIDPATLRDRIEARAATDQVEQKITAALNVAQVLRGDPTNAQRTST